MKHLHDYSEYLSFKENQGGTWLLFKHSPTCPISLAAHKHVAEFMQDHDTPILLLDVLDTGDAKFQIADDLGITHESPQMIVFCDGKVRSHASHLSVTARRLRQEIDGWNDTRKTQ